MKLALRNEYLRAADTATLIFGETTSWLWSRRSSLYFKKNFKRIASQRNEISYVAFHVVRLFTMNFKEQWSQSRYTSLWWEKNSTVGEVLTVLKKKFQMDCVTEKRDIVSCISCCSFVYCEFQRTMEPAALYITSVSEEQRCVVRCYFLRNKTPTKIYVKLRKVYCDETMGQNTVFTWYCMFRAGCVDVAMRLSTSARVTE